MTVDQASCAEELRDGLVEDVVLSPDARILRRAMREVLSTSPDGFLRTVAEIDRRSAGYWEDELRSSTWVVMQSEDEVVGIAAAKLPGEDDIYIEDKLTARFIESVWIAPSLRGNRYSMQLVKHLIDAECKKSANIDRFLLWVFNENKTAIRVYQDMGFESTGLEQEKRKKDGTCVVEVQYQLLLDSTLAVAVELDNHMVACKQDWCYRILGEGTAAARPSLSSRYLKASTVES
jgi:GNAT superfamily N-acetyltransferase